MEEFNTMIDRVFDCRRSQGLDVCIDIENDCALGEFSSCDQLEDDYYLTLIAAGFFGTQFGEVCILYIMYVYHLWLCPNMFDMIVKYFCMSPLNTQINFECLTEKTIQARLTNLRCSIKIEWWYMDI